MNDLSIAIVVMSILCLGLGLLTALYFRTLQGQLPILGLALCTLAMFYFLFYGNGQLFWARFVPSSAAIIYTNLASVFAAVGAGFATRLPNTPLWRRSGLVVLMGSASLAAIFWPLLSIAVRPPPPGGDRWHNRVAMQTSWATCSPAAAATLFRGEGIDVSESELIPLCLTDSSGTPTLGLYRGVKLIAQRHGRTVSIVPSSLEQLIEDNAWPVLVTAELPYGVQDRSYVEERGWVPGLGHSAVILGTTEDGRFQIGDPSVGLELWTRNDLDLLWQGAGIRVD